MAVSFANDIVPFLTPWRSQMLWRLDLTSYDDVKMNAQIISDQISSTPPGMPPPPMQGLSAEEISLFSSWITDGVPP
jgi:hypothetical protein